MVTSRPFHRFVAGIGVVSLAALAACDSSGGNSVASALSKVPPTTAATAGGPPSLRWPLMLVELGQVDDGVAAARALLDTRGDDPPFAIQVAHIAASADRPAAAGEIYRHVLATHPDNIDALVGDGVVLAHADELDAAKARFRQALVLQPSDVAARNDLAMALILSGQPEQALPILEALSQEPAGSDLVRANLALARGASPAVAAVASRAPADRDTAPANLQDTELSVGQPVGIAADFADADAPAVSRRAAKAATKPAHNVDVSPMEAPRATTGTNRPPTR